MINRVFERKRSTARISSDFTRFWGLACARYDYMWLFRLLLQQLALWLEPSRTSDRRYLFVLYSSNDQGPRSTVLGKVSRMGSRLNWTSSPLSNIGRVLVT